MFEHIGIVKTVLLGNSLGGVNAYQFAARHPERVKALIIEDIGTDEIEAAVLGAQWVAARGDPALMRGARDLIAKIEAVVPAHLRPFILESTLMAPNLTPCKPDALDMERVRTWMRTQGKLQIRYSENEGRDSNRVIWSIAVAYFETVRLIVAWCKLRQAFRHFRTDRINSVNFLNETFTTRTEILRAA